MNKQHILNEIKRTAKDNNDEPLGSMRFARKTGIGESAWGHYWSRWGDALTEAGFAPKQMQTAYSDEFLIEKFIGLARELQRYPTARDIRVKSHKEEFPDKKTFSRLGLKAKFASRIIDYCQKRQGYDDVIRWCAEIQHESNRQSEDGRTPEMGDVGFVYLLKHGRYYKIGKTNSIGRREYELGTKLPEDLRRVHVIRTDDPTGIEAYWHKRFEAKRKKGEWFDLDAADVDAFKRRKEFM